MGTDAKIASALADRQIELFRFDANISNYAIKSFKQLEKDIKRLASGLSASPGQKELRDLKKETRILLSSSYKDISEYTDSELDGFSDHEAEIIALLLSQITGKKIKPIRVKEKPNIGGVDLSEYWKQSEETTALQLNASISKGVIDDKDSNEIATAAAIVIAGRINGIKSLIRTSTQTLANQSRQRLYESILGIKGYIHTSILDGRTSVICLVRANSIWDLDHNPIMGTTEPFEIPPLHHNCRSYLRPWLGDEIEHLTGEDWLFSRSADQQDALLGRGRADLWRRGVITWADLLNQQGRPLTLKELMALYGY